MKKKITLIFNTFLAFLITACATPSAMTPTSASTATQRPSSTAPPTLTPTMTQTPSPTPIPPTPEGAEGLTYDPDNRSLIDPQGTPIFSLDENNLWVEVVPEWMGEMEKEIEEMGFADEEVVIEESVLMVGGEQVAREGDGGVEIWVEGEWKQARRASVGEEVWGRVYRVGGKYYKWYQESGWRVPEPIVDVMYESGVDPVVLEVASNWRGVEGDWGKWSDVDSYKTAYDLRDLGDGAYLAQMNRGPSLVPVAVRIEKEQVLGEEEETVVRYLLMQRATTENEEPFLFQFMVSLQTVNLFNEGAAPWAVVSESDFVELWNRMVDNEGLVRNKTGEYSFQFSILSPGWNGCETWVAGANEACIEEFKAGDPEDFPTTIEEFRQKLYEVWSKVRDEAREKGCWGRQSIEELLREQGFVWEENVPIFEDEQLVNELVVGKQY